MEKLKFNLIKIVAKPDVLEAMSAIDSKRRIQKAPAVKFYFRGGGDVLLLRRSSKTALEYYISPICEIQGKDVQRTITELIKEIVEEMETCRVENKHWFLFDVKTKKVLTLDSFIDYIPFRTMKRSLFMFTTDDGAPRGSIYFLQDQSDYHMLQVSALFMAKRDFSPPDGGKWSLAAKQFAHFVVADSVQKPPSFTTPNGCWDGVVWEDLLQNALPSSIDLDSLNTTRATQLSKAPATEEKTDKVVAEPFDRILLSEILQIGVVSFIGGSYDVVEVEVDLMKETISEMKIDCKTGQVYVKVVPGVEVNLDTLAEDLQCTSVDIVIMAGKE